MSEHSGLKLNGSIGVIGPDVVFEVSIDGMTVGEAAAELCSAGVFDDLVKARDYMEWLAKEHADWRRGLN